MFSSRANNERRGSVSDADSDEENEEGDYTVYECPGLAAVSLLNYCYTLELINRFKIENLTKALCISTSLQMYNYRNGP